MLPSIPESLGSFTRNEPLSRHTTLQIGGPADIFAEPDTLDLFQAWIEWARRADVPYWIIGGGANILVSDNGIRGLVLSTCGLNTCVQSNPRQSGSVPVSIAAGTDVSAAVEWCAGRGLGGLDFLYGMPGSIGGAVWMNARCYGAEIAAILESVECLIPGEGSHTYQYDPADWDYKLSPFQQSDWIILSAQLHLHKEDPATIRSRMQAHQADREGKGHFRYPSAGSMFKNNYRLGKPSGQIIDELGMRGTRIGDAQIAPYHGNIFINTGRASAADMRELVGIARSAAADRLEITLEPEVLFIGEW